ncbi:MAG: energy-coupling factor transporter transmembrane protein EcfT [Clostridia bacterium]|nr:energy-coupling factor transporter transmembrane protein EcfT [Clostridia bacterium]
MFYMHPVCLAVTLASGFVYSVMLKGPKAIKTNLLYMLPTMLITALMNPAFNHEGVTILTYLPSGNPLTLESILYGLSAAVMIVSVMCHFSCYNAVMTSDKFIYLFGRVIPSLSLILSMTLRFVPKFTSQLKVVTNAQKCIGRDVSNGSLLQRAKNGISILSVMVTWSLENAVETADSMKSRGYGMRGRTAFSIFRFDKRDAAALLCISFLGVYVLVGGVAGGMDFRYFPSVKATEPTIYTVSIFAAYFALCALPIAVEVLEVRKWKAIRSKI